MIVTQLLGGLGNQMFQFATAAALAKRRATPLALDVSSFREYGRHNGFELIRVFGIQAPLATASDIRSLLGWRGHPLALRALRRALRHLLPPQYVAEPHVHYWTGLAGVSDDAYLVGLWQSERYFLDEAREIRAWFRFRTPLDNRNAEWSERITRTAAVCVHVRRGDYATDPETQACHSTVGPEYYARAARLYARANRPAFILHFLG